MLLLFSIILVLGVTGLYVEHKGNKNLSNGNLNIDIDGDGKCNLNCDTNNDGRPDTNLYLDNDGKCDLYCDTDGDGVCDEKCDDPLIDIIEGEAYVLTLTDSSTYNKNNIIPGWTGSKSFKLSNSTSSPQVVNMNWINVKNTFTTVNNLYYSVSRNYVTLIKML